MGVGINSALSLVGSAGVASSKIAQSIDADSNERAAATAKYQQEKLKSIKLENRKKRLEIKQARNTLKKGEINNG